MLWPAAAVPILLLGRLFTGVRSSIRRNARHTNTDARRGSECDPSIVSPNVNLNTDRDIYIYISFSGEEEEEDSRVRRTRVSVEEEAASTMAARD